MDNLNLLHIRAEKDFGRGYLNPRRSGEVLRAIYARIDKAEARVTEVEGRIRAFRDDDDQDRDQTQNELFAIVDQSGKGAS